MKKSLLIVLIVISVLLTPAVIIGIAVLDGYGFFEYYGGWSRVDVPTDTDLIATVKLPDEWSFSKSNGKIYIIDNNGDIVATEIYEGIRINHYKGQVHYDNYDEIVVNSDLVAPYNKLDNYEFIRGADSCYLYGIKENGHTRYAILMEIYAGDNFDGDYSLFLLFENGTLDENIFRKMQKSFRWGGYIKGD